MDGHGISLSRTVSNKALLHPCVPYYPLRAMEHHFLAKCCLAFFGGDAKSLAWVFLARRVLPFVFFFAFFGGDAKSLAWIAWVFLARRVLPFVLGFFCCLFFGGDAKSLAWVFLARRVLPFVVVFPVVFSTKWTPCISLLNGFGVLVERCWSRNLCSNEHLY